MFEFTPVKYKLFPGTQIISANEAAGAKTPSKRIMIVVLGMRDDLQRKPYQVNCV